MKFYSFILLVTISFTHQAILGMKSKEMDQKLAEILDEAQSISKYNATKVSDYNNKIAQAELLLSRGANINGIVLQGDRSRSVWQLVTPLEYVISNKFDSSLEKRAEVVGWMIDHGARPNTYDTGKITPLIRAILAHEPEVIDVLLAKGADPLLPDGHGDSPLMVAIEEGSLTAVSSIFNWFERMQKERTVQFQSIKDHSNSYLNLLPSDLKNCISRLGLIELYPYLKVKNQRGLTTLDMARIEVVDLSRKARRKSSENHARNKIFELVREKIAQAEMRKNLTSIPAPIFL